MSHLVKNYYLGHHSGDPNAISIKTHLNELKLDLYSQHITEEWSVKVLDENLSSILNDSKFIRNNKGETITFNSYETYRFLGNIKHDTKYEYICIGYNTITNNYLIILYIYAAIATFKELSKMLVISPSKTTSPLYDEHTQKNKSI